MGQERALILIGDMEGFIAVFKSLHWQPPTKNK